MPIITAVTFTPEKEEYKVLASILGGIADVRCTADLDLGEKKAVFSEAEVLFSKSFATAEVTIEEASLLQQVKLVQLIFAGTDRVPHAAMPDNAVVAGNAGAFAGPLAEHVLGMVLCLAKKLVPGHAALAQGRFEHFVYSRELKGGTCAVIGMGGNGAAIAALMKGVGMRVLGINRSGRSEAALDFMGTLADMDAVLQAADVVVLTVPLTRATLGMIGRRELQRMKPDAILINVARGMVVDQKALYDHLETTPSFSAGIDTWWSEPADGKRFKVDYPFFELPNVLGSPHKADHVPAMMAKAVQKAAENVRDFLEGKPIRGRVNKADYL